VLHTARRSSLWDAHCCAPLAAYLRISEQPHLRVLALLPVGFARPPHHCDAGALLPHLFTLTSPRCGEAVCFLLHFPSGHPAWPLASTVLCGVRTFLIPPQRDATARQTRTLTIISPNGECTEAGARHLKVMQETRTAETRRTQRFLHNIPLRSLRLSSSVSQITPKLSAPCVNAPLRTLLSFCLPCWKR
jgi:hypothetical protein